MAPLSSWQNYYVIVGSSAGALIGLQFVVMGLIASIPAIRRNSEAGRTFSTPTIVHFGTVLGLSALLSAPWESVGTPALIWGAAGSIGVIYALIITWRMRAQNAYRPEFEDWLFHSLLPLAAYVLLAGSAWYAQFTVRESLFGAAAAVLLLLFIGIHNAWDAVTYHIFTKGLGSTPAANSSNTPEC
jgi:hypothetical protein